jgi:hypothetical protein
MKSGIDTEKANRLSGLEANLDALSLEMEQTNPDDSYALTGLIDDLEAIVTELKRLRDEAQD